MITALFCAGFAVGLINHVVKHGKPVAEPEPELDRFRTCGECYFTVSGPEVHPRCPECGAPLDVRAVA